VLVNARHQVQLEWPAGTGLLWSSPLILRRQKPGFGPEAATFAVGFAAMVGFVAAARFVVRGVAALMSAAVRATAMS